MKLTSTGFVFAATDLSNHLSCPHLSLLHRKEQLDEIKRPSYRDPSLDILIERGRQHEAAYVAYLKSTARTVEDLRGKNVGATLDAMTRGVDVIVQAQLGKDQWMGFADILVKTNKPSRLGQWSYEIQDTKLAQNTKAATILQLCLYSDLLADLQGVSPEWMYVIKPGQDFPTEQYRYDDFVAYYRLTKKRFEEAIYDDNYQTYPEPVEHCGICSWWQHCDKQRHDDDHLSLVAGMRSLHIEELKERSINTLESFAKAEPIHDPRRGNRETYARKQEQAKIQLGGRGLNTLLHKPINAEAGRGLDRLPEPSPGDIYYDIEGDAFFEGGLEYILGYAYKDNNSLSYVSHWSHSRNEEKEAFMHFMEFVIQRWKRFPKMYIYHFAPYEPAAVKRLARVHAVYEKEVDDLLRAERFIDLHAVFKEAFLASVETYSLKQLEGFTDYVRMIDLHEASKARKRVEIALELGEPASIPDETRKTTERYNQDDCLATEALHRWLEQKRTELINQGANFVRPELKTGEATENVQLQDTRSIALFQSLTRNLPVQRIDWTPEQEAKWLLAHMIDYFRREDKSAWWEYFRVHELEYDDLLDERKAIAGLEFVAVLPKTGKERNPTHRYHYPPQETGIDEDDVVVEVKGETIGVVKAIQPDKYIIDIRKSGNAIDRHPKCIHVSDRVDPGSLATSLMDLAALIDEDGLGRTWPQYAAKDLLMKREPQLIDNGKGAFILPGEDLVAAAIRIASNLNKSVLPIQGPPGSGKTYTAARMIIELAKQRKKIGITAISHKVIRNLMQRVQELSVKEGVTISFVHKLTEKSDKALAGITEVTDSKKALEALQQGCVVGGTAWLWADKNSSEKLDYLFVDEAGQMSLSHVLAASRAAHNLILLGDPQQLEQPQKGAHPEGSDVAALTYLLDGSQTMPEGKGLFLGVTRRMHPSITAFTSELFYENKLTSLPGLEKQVISGGTSFDGAGLFYVPVVHRGNGNKSMEEVDAVVRIVQTLRHARWTDSQGETRLITTEEILIVAPYNAQVSALLEKLPEHRIGTVDKFQGQEAPVVIYTLTSSSAEDAPRGMGFVYNPNRLNVATSRARSTCILVASPRLMEPACHTIDQMMWANGMCRYLELAREVRM